MLGISQRTMHRIIDEGLIPYIRPAGAISPGAHKQVRESDVLAFQQRCQGEAHPPQPQVKEWALRCPRP